MMTAVRAHRPIPAGMLALVLVAGLLTTAGALLVRSDAAATFVVDSPADTGDATLDGVCDDGTGACTLRAALQEANAVVSLDTITFDLPAATTRIGLGSKLPDITDGVTIDARTQPGWVAGGAPAVTVDFNGANGLVLNADAITVQGLALVDLGGNALDIRTVDGVLLTDNYLGLEADGTTVAGSSNRTIEMSSGSTNVVIGAPGAGNVITGGGAEELHLRGTGHVVQGNIIGMDASGTVATGGNGAGIELHDGSPLIGGTVAGAGNLIAGNGVDGEAELEIQVGSPTVQGNIIGLQADGTTPVATAGDAVRFVSGDGTNVLIGGTVAGAGNTIGGTRGDGVAVENDADHVSILGNSIRDSGALGIDIEDGTQDAFGITQNDPGDGDNGANERMNRPVLTQVGASAVRGYADLQPGTYRVEVFNNPDGADPSGSGEGQVFLGATTMTHTGGGNEFFTATGLPAISDGDLLTATVTRCTLPDCSSFGATSEFSVALGALVRPALSGTVYEDVDGDGTLADGVPVGAGDVAVRLYLDDGDGTPGDEDPLLGATSTRGDGSWSLQTQASGTVWVAFGAAGMTPAAGLEAGATPGELVAEQTYAAAGGASFDGASWSFTAAAGPLHGGARRTGGDGFPSLATAEHVLRASAAGVDVGGLDVAFSFRSVTSTADALPTDPFTDVTAWSTFDPSTAGVDVDATGFENGAFDGRYLYFAPDTNATGTHGTVLRFDTQGTFGAAASWAVFDADAAFAADATGYSDAVFDGRYVYFSPEVNTGGRHANVLRYDTQGAFTAAGSWSLFDPAAALGGDPRGFQGAVFDGQFLHFGPAAGNTTALRYDTTLAFAAGASWTAFDLAAGGVAGDLLGYDTDASFDGRYAYWSSGATTSGEVLRLDTFEVWDSVDAWTTYDPSDDGIGSAGNRGTVIADGALYLVPDNDGAYHGEVLRHELSLAFDDPSAWSVHDPAVDAGNTGYDGAVFDGRYLYFAPSFDDGGGWHGEVLRLDTTGTFGDDASWSVFDPMANLVGSSPEGYDGAFWDGTHVYFVPDGSSTGLTHGEVLRYTPARPLQGQLRTTLANADVTAGADAIRWDLATTDAGYDATTGAWTSATVQHLEVGSTVTMDGTTQPGWSDEPVVHLDASSHATTAPAGRGLTVSGDGVTIRGLSLTGTPSTGLHVTGDAFTVVDTWVGVAPDGTVDGPDALHGIAVQSPTTATIGSGSPGEEVVLVGAAAAGLRLEVGGTTDLTVDGVLVGRTLDGTVVGNGGHGIDAADAVTGRVRNAVVTGNGGAGIAIVDPSSSLAVTGSSIHGNGGLGIDLLGDGLANPNDAGDADSGPNGLLNVPVLTVTSDDVGAVRATVTLDLPAGDHRIQLFRNPSGLDATAGEGEVLVAEVDVTTPTAPITIDVAGATATDDLTATATLLSAGVPVATSEFSVGIVGPGTAGTSSTPTLPDSSPGREDGRPAGAMDAADVVTGQVGDGLTFDGVDDRVALFGPTPATTAQTVSAWVRPDADGTIVERHDGGAVQWSVGRTGGALVATVGTTATPVVLAGGPLPLGAWTHVALVVDGGTATLYLDGAPVATAAGTYAIGAADRTWIGGGGAAGTTTPFAGAVDELRISDRALGADQLATEVALASTAPTLGAVQLDGNAAWQVDGTVGRTDSSSLLAPVDTTSAWLTLDGVDEVGLEVRSWWLLQGSPQDIGVGVRATPGGAGTVQDELVLDATGWGLARWDTTRTDLVAPPAGQSPGGPWQQVTLRTDQDGTLSAIADGVGIGPFPGPGVRPSGTVGFRTALLTGIQRWWVDDVLVRRYVTPEPTARLAPSQPAP